MISKVIARLTLPFFVVFGLAVIAVYVFDELNYEPPKTMLEAKDLDVALVYNSRYNVTAFGLERLHPFDSSKYKKIKEYLEKSCLSSDSNFLSPDEISRSDLELVHSKKYLDSLKHSSNLARILEIAPAAFCPGPILDWRVLRAMRYASGGTILACEAALKHGISINIGGGYHHACSDSGGGFCVYSDVPIAIKVLRNKHLIKRALIVDTDAHQGNGFASVAQNQPNTFVLDFYDDSIYPNPKEVEDMSVPLLAGTAGPKYLQLLREYLPKAIEKFKPDLIVYNAGSDVLDSDPLSSLRLTVRDLNIRDKYVVETARNSNIPIAMVLAGGYSSESALAQAKSIEQILERFN